MRSLSGRGNFIDARDGWLDLCGHRLDGRLQLTAGVADPSVNLNVYLSPDTGFGFNADVCGGVVESPEDGLHRA